MKRLIPFRTGSGGSSPEGRQTATRRHANEVSRTIEGRLEHADIDKKTGKTKKGNSAESMQEVTFARADKDVFVDHDLGYTCSNWSVVRKSKAGDIYDGTRKPSKFGLWLRSNVAGMKATIRVDGQRGNT